MAAQSIHFCTRCGYTIDAWDDGHPYIEYPPGKRNYYYHPCEPGDLEKIARRFYGRAASQEEIESMWRSHCGNESVFVCRDCRKTSRIDPRRDAVVCASCHSVRVEDVCGLSGKPRLNCGEPLQTRMGAIS